MNYRNCYLATKVDVFTRGIRLLFKLSCVNLLHSFTFTSAYTYTYTYVPHPDLRYKVFLLLFSSSFFLLFLLLLPLTILLSIFKAFYCTMVVLENCISTAFCTRTQASKFSHEGRERKRKRKKKEKGKRTSISLEVLFSKFRRRRGSSFIRFSLW